MEIKDLINPNIDLSDFSDKNLYHLCQQYGGGIKILRRIFAVLLTEVNHRRLHRKYGFESIYEFGAKVGGMNKELVSQILWLAESLKDKPCLWREFRREGWSKVRVVASVATSETDEIWAKKVSILPKPALEELVKDWKRENLTGKSSERCVSFQFGNEDCLLPKATPWVGGVGGVGGKNAPVFPVVCEKGDLVGVAFDWKEKNVLDNFPKNNDRNADLPLPEQKNEITANLGEVNSLNSANLGLDSTTSWSSVGVTHGLVLVKMHFNVSLETEFKFLLFKQRLCKKQKEALTSGEILAILLDEMEKDFKKI